MNLDAAAKVLGVDLPTELRLVKSAFRRMALFVHPDVGGDPEKFRQVEEAYRVLSASPEALTSIEETTKTTICGRPLEELGQGYPLNISAKTCGNCDGRGYQLVKMEEELTRCTSCEGDGHRKEPCKKCGGDGVFKIRGNPKGTCYTCDGSGVYDYWKAWKKKNLKTAFDYLWRRAPAWTNCRECSGAGMAKDPNTGKMEALICDGCKGIGEIKMFNPVLPRGLLTGAGGRR